MASIYAFLDEDVIIVVDSEKKEKEEGFEISMRFLGLISKKNSLVKFDSTTDLQSFNAYYHLDHNKASMYLEFKRKLMYFTFETNKALELTH